VQAPLHYTKINVKILLYFQSNNKEFVTRAEGLVFVARSISTTFSRKIGSEAIQAKGLEQVKT